MTEAVRLKKIEQLIRKLEWSGNVHHGGVNLPACPACGGARCSKDLLKRLKRSAIGHARDCLLLKRIADCAAVRLAAVGARRDREIRALAGRNAHLSRLLSKLRARHASALRQLRKLHRHEAVRLKMLQRQVKSLVNRIHHSALGERPITTEVQTSGGVANSK